MNLNNYVKKGLKIIAWIVGCVILLLVLIALAFTIPAVQNAAGRKAVSYLSNKLHTTVSLGSIRIVFPKSLELRDLYIADQRGDTLLYGHRLLVNISMLKLLSNEIEVNNLEMERFTAHVYRVLPDTTFNFDFVVKAFSSDQEQPQQEKDTSAPLQFSLDKISLQDIYCTYRDQVTGMDAGIRLGSFDTRIRKFDLEKQDFNIRRIGLSDIQVRVVQTKPLLPPAPAIPDTAAAGPPPQITLGSITLDKIQAYYRNDMSGLISSLQLGSLEIRPDNIDLAKQQVALDLVALKNTDAAMTLYASPYADSTAALKDTAAAKAEEAGQGWMLTLNRLALDHDNIRFDNNLEQPAPRGMDYSHLDVRDLNLHANGIHYDPQTIKAGIEDFSFSERHSGFRLLQLKTDAVYDSTKARLSDLLLQTGGSTIRNTLGITYDSLGMFSTNIGKLGIEGVFDDCTISMEDVLYFVPSLAASSSFRKLSHAVIALDGRVNGTLNDLHIPELKIAAGGGTHLYAKADLRGLPDMEHAYFDVTVNDLAATRRDLATLLPDSMIPSSIQVPAAFSLKAAYKGSLSNFSADVQLRSSYGNAHVKAAMQGPKGGESYTADVVLDKFDVGQLLRQDTTLGTVTLTLGLHGTGTDAKTAAAGIKGHIIQAEVKGYNYRDLVLEGAYDHQQLEMKAAMADPNIRFNLSAGGDLSGEYPAVQLNLDLDSANLYALHLTGDVMKLRGKIAANLPTADVDHLNGQLSLTGFQLVKKDALYLLDTLSVQAMATDTMDRITLRSEIVSASLWGKFRLSQLGAALNGQIRHYFDTAGVARHPLVADSAMQDITFNATLHNPPVLRKFLPNLTAFAGATINGRLNTQQSLLKLNAQLPRVVYGNLEVDSLQLHADGDEDSLAYALTLDQVQNGSMHIFDTRLSGGLARDQLSVNLVVKDEAAKDKYQLAGILKALPHQYEFHFLPGGLELNYQPWQVPEDNFLRYGTSGIRVNNLQLQHGDQFLRINSTEPRPNAPLEVVFHDFQLETLTKMAEKDTALAGGTINGQVLLENLLESPVFTADLNITAASFKNDTIGNVAVQVNNKTANAYTAQIGIKGNGNDLSLGGTYYTQPQSSFQFALDINRLKMSTIAAFSAGQLADASGMMDGNMQITGTTTAPQVGGSLHFNKAAFRIAYLGSMYSLPDETISFDDQGIRFNRFSLLDSAGNKAVLNGYVYTEDYRFYRFGLDITARNFRALNTKQSDEQLFYGPVYIDTDIRLRGDMNVPRVDMNLRLRQNSVFTVVLPTADPGIVERDGVIRFIDPGHLNDTVRLATASEDTISRSRFKGLQLSANITVDTSAQLNVIVDQQNGDNLSVRGDARLNATIDPSGKISLTGRYEIVEGAYQMSFNGLIQRRFEIAKGSTIIWTGDPTSAQVDITAIYNIETSAEELVADQLGNASTATRTTYKQKLPFEVELIMEGELLKPQISFAIDMPESYRNAFNGSVYTRIKQINQVESELNKQVLGLLVFNHFIANDPFSSLAGGGGGGISTLARQSASKILTQQLNNLADQLIKGVDVNFDLQSQEDYSTGHLENRTDLNVGLSKQLFNGRTTVYVGSNVELEGPQTPGRKASNIAGDVSVEYKLTPDGRYRLRFYRTDQYEGIVEGQVVKTGASFLLVMDYNHFRELFEPKRSKKGKTDKKRKQ